MIFRVSPSISVRLFRLLLSLVVPRNGGGGILVVAAGDAGGGGEAAEDAIKDTSESPLEGHGS